MKLSKVFLPIALVVSCESSRRSSAPVPDDGSSGASPAHKDLNDEYHWRETFLHMNQSDGIIRLLKLRPRINKDLLEEYDGAIKRLMVTGCGMYPGHDAAYRQLMNTPVEEFFPLNVVEDAKLIGCGYLITSDGRRHQGLRPITKD